MRVNKMSRGKDISNAMREMVVFAHKSGHGYKSISKLSEIQMFLSEKLLKLHLRAFTENVNVQDKPKRPPRRLLHCCAG